MSGCLRPCRSRRGDYVGDVRWMFLFSCCMLHMKCFFLRTGRAACGVLARGCMYRMLWRRALHIYLAGHCRDRYPCPNGLPPVPYLPSSRLLGRLTTSTRIRICGADDDANLPHAYSHVQLQVRGEDKTKENLSLSSPPLSTERRTADLLPAGTTQLSPFFMVHPHWRCRFDTTDTRKAYEGRSIVAAAP